MKLSSSVMDVVRGVGGAAILAVAVGASGCGGAGATTTTTTTTTTLTASSNERSTPPTVEPTHEQIVTPVSYSTDDPEQYPAPCGRG